MIAVFGALAGTSPVSLGSNSTNANFLVSMSHKILKLRAEIKKVKEPVKRANAYHQLAQEYRSMGRPADALRWYAMRLGVGACA